MVPIFIFRKQTDFSVNSTKNQRNYLKIKHYTSLGYSEGYQSQTAQQMSSLPRECRSCSVTKPCLTFCNPMDCGTPGFPVLHCLPEFAQSQVHWVDDAIQPSHPLYPLLLLPSIFPSIRVFSNELVLCIRQPKVLELQFQPQFFQWIFRVDFIYHWLTWSPCCWRDSWESSPAPHFESFSSSALSLPYAPTLTSEHDYWKDQSFDYMETCQQSDVSAF